VVSAFHVDLTTMKTSIKKKRRNGRTFNSLAIDKKRVKKSLLNGHLELSYEHADSGNIVQNLPTYILAYLL
jgi:hypothetical protein